MADKLLIVMVNTDPSNPSELAVPLFQATVAAAMEYDVEVILCGRSGELAVKGMAERIIIDQASSRTAYDAIKEALEAGAKFKVCTSATDQWGDDLIPEIEEIVGGAYLISEAMDDGTVTFTY